MNHKKLYVLLVGSDFSLKDPSTRIGVRSAILFIISVLVLCLLETIVLKFVPSAAVYYRMSSFSIFATLIGVAYYFCFTIQVQREFSQKKTSMTRLQRHLCKKNIAVLRFISIGAMILFPSAINFLIIDRLISG